MNVKKLFEGMFAEELEGMAEEALDAKLRELADGLLQRKALYVRLRTKKSGREAIREALYHYWASIFGGDIGDRIRDRQEKKIVAAVAAKIDDNTAKNVVIDEVRLAIVNLVF